MVPNINKPNYFGSGHVLNSKLVLEPCKKFVIWYKLDPKYDKNFIEHNFNISIG